MIFPTVAFAVFFVLAFLVNWLLRPHHRAWLLGLGALSLGFYAYDPHYRKYVVLLVASGLGNWFLGEAIGRARDPDARRWLVRLAVAANLAVLWYFKYYVFTQEHVLTFLPARQILLPIAISFFTFHALSYVIDIGRGEIGTMRLDEFVVYMSFFPHLVAGPIVRASEFGPQLRSRPDPRSVEFAEAARLIVGGLFKKVVISSFVFSNIVDPVFGSPDVHGRLDLLVAVYAFAVQIYCDFSGYTDIAIGCALLLGIRFPQNFDSPYRALSLQDFWRRWHMTLSRWLRDYLYIPLGGNRGSRLVGALEPRYATYLNLFLTMLIGGFWHGASWAFVVWGAIHGGFLGLERFVRERWRARHPQPVAPRWVSAPLQWLLTFHVVCFAWIFFEAGLRAPDSSWTIATAYVAGLFRGAGDVVLAAPLVTGLLVVVIALSLASQFVPPDFGRRLERAFRRWSPVAQGAAIAGSLTMIDVLGPDGVAPFIYFAF